MRLNQLPNSFEGPPLPAEAKPLFRPDALRPRLAEFVLPPRIQTWREKLDRWVELLRSGRADRLSESQLLPEFLSDIFIGLLGYTGPAAGGSRYTLSREQHVEVDGKFADAVLGEFADGSSKFLAALEGKGSRDPLVRPFAGRRMSAVDQAYRYAINLPCDWIVVTNLREIRLQYKGCDQYTLERFEVERLAQDETSLRRFVFLLGAERVVPAEGRCHLYELLGDSERLGKELTLEYYSEYARMRQEAFDQLRVANPGEPPAAILAVTQKLLDRVLFCAFSEARGLLPSETIANAYRHTDPYNPRPIWENFRGLFRSIDEGNPQLEIPQYNGGLFEWDKLLEHLIVPDKVCEAFAKLADYDYRPAGQAVEESEKTDGAKLIDVDILGHIFEQSISDLERLRNRLEGRLADEEPVSKTRRKKEGAFYTPSFITRYIVGEALGRVLADRFEFLRIRHEHEASPPARSALADPKVYNLDDLKKPQRSALVRFWEDWQEELKKIRLVDPACGSGAFLIQAFDQFHASYQASNDRLKELRGQPSLFDLDRQILEYNLHGVDLNDEAVQICKLSLWIKTAHYGKILSSLEHIRMGNSIVEDPAVDPKAFNWTQAFPESFAAGGFDVVVGNPPYVRQEWISSIKPYLQEHYKSYDGMADLYVYFYERGMELLKPGGRLSFVVTNKWMKAGYGEPLRKFFADNAWLESMVDFGHAKQIFEEADVFPSILVARKPAGAGAPRTARVCTIPREQLRIDDLAEQIRAEGFEIQRDRLTAEPWTLEPPGVTDLLEKIRRAGVPLKDFVGVKPYRGILTGLNEAFLIDGQTKDALVAADARSAEVLKPFLRGQDINRWSPNWEGLWMIALKSSGDHDWPWSSASEGAEKIFAETYAAIHSHLDQFSEALIKRQDQGRFWWELRACAYWDEFNKPKIVYQEIQFHPCYALDSQGMLGNNKTFFVPTDDLCLLAILNSPLMWWHNWRFLPHMKDEALSPVAFLMESLPIVQVRDKARSDVEAAVRRLIEIASQSYMVRRDLLNWLRLVYGVEKPSQRLSDPLGLGADDFIKEVKRVRKRAQTLTIADLNGLREEHARSIEPARELGAEALALERQVSDLVNAAYGLTPDEVALMWKTAPPRMPIKVAGSRPNAE